MNHAGKSKVAAKLTAMERELGEDSHRLLCLLTALQCVCLWQNQVNKAESEARCRGKCAKYE